MNTLGNSIYDLETQSSSLRLDIMNKERELSETDLYKEITELKLKDRKICSEIEERKDNVKKAMLDAGLKSMDFEHQKVTLKKSGGSVKILNEEEIPDVYKKEKTTIQLDKKKIKDGIKEGDIIPGASIEYGYSLLITPKK